MAEDTQNKDTAQQGAAAGDDSAKLQADLEAATKQIQDLTEISKRALADLQNFRKKTDEEKAVFVQFANAALILELLPILDNFGRAFAQVPPEVQKTDWFKGALQIEQQLMGVTKKMGVTEMPPTVGKKLDANLHEAITVGPGEKDTVTEEFEKGYMLGNRVLRPAKVRVGDGSVKLGRV